LNLKAFLLIWSYLLLKLLQYSGRHKEDYLPLDSDRIPAGWRRDPPDQKQGGMLVEIGCEAL
jgi:hypothetical protein